MSQQHGPSRIQSPISADLSTVLPDDQVLKPFKAPFKRDLDDHVEAQQKSMKRSRAQVSPTMSPGASNEGFDANGDHLTANSLAAEVVTIVGAGPAGLMLGYVLLRWSQVFSKHVMLTITVRTCRCMV